MSDRGRSRRTARSTKATAPKATPDTEVEPGDEPAATEGAESDKTPSGAAAAAETPAAETTGADETVSLDKQDDEPAEADASDDADADADADAEADDADDPDASADGDADEDADAEAETGDGKGKTGKAASKSKAPTPMTKAEKRAAARIAAAKAARRRRTGQAIAGTLIVLLVVGGAFAGVWYFGDRAEKNRVKCKPAADAAAFPPLLGGMNKALATEPTITPSSDEVKTVRTTILVKGECKAVKAGQTVSVNYVGATMKDGKVFDASWPRKKTIEIPVGQKQLGKQPQVIEGWDEGLVGLKVGTRVQLDVPGNKAYGDDAPEGYPAGTLRFIVDILDAKDADSSGLPAGLGG
ncbi:FKBP-type peptidyl-prolyl cis-trans isomerase [Dactylosporangium sp. NBC_01737]|uniref:FKBP-type peptidyl-prolyl cis-trans isomerase n=1 Tax=Dactylosporangium sp. NBC_01737 TaxID=2975959 RepID=UPI002E12F74F|nr:FKBP-type peptidyl-prolyl cis-trans isomerase [Dactylosporangium sp. NBC_01737]